jgi:hypothetical protein
LLHEVAAAVSAHAAGGLVSQRRERRRAGSIHQLAALTVKLHLVAADASSTFGAQLDSFTDFFSFGVAPTVLIYAFFHATPSAGWTTGPRAILLPIIALGFLICVASRLSRFNATREQPAAKRMFVGWPTTYIGGMLGDVRARPALRRPDLVRCRSG